MATISENRPGQAGPTTVSIGRGTQPAPPAAPTDAASQARPADQVRLTETVNPYADISGRTAQVRADAWRRGPNGSVEQILARQGYSREDMYRKDADGHTLIERVAKVNGMQDPNLLREGQSLLVPVKPEQAPTPPARNGNGTAPQASTGNRNANGTQSVGVTVDRWGQGPNDSLESILRHQGYSLSEIHRKDSDGRTMLDRVAASNGLENSNQLRAGERLVVPGRRQDGQGQGQQGQGGHQGNGEGGQQGHEVTPPAPTPPAPRGQEAPPTPAPPAPTPQGQVTPAPAPPAPPEDGEATTEMGLLLNGAREGKLNRDEFRALNSHANRYEEIRARYGRDGFDNGELRHLGRLEGQYGDMYARFNRHDRSRISFEGGDATSTDPRIRERMRLLEQSGSLWDGLADGTVSYDEAAGQLISQRRAARQLGEGGN